MEWYITLTGMFGMLTLLFLAGMPVAFAFLLINVVGLYFFMGGEKALALLVTSAFDSVATFVLVTVPLFILMGELMFHSGVATRALDALDRWFGRLPGRLSLVAVGGGTIFAALSGSSMATTAMLGATLVPEMTRRGYSYVMSIGAISAGGGLAVIIPPTALGVLLAALAKISVAQLLIAGIIPGLFRAVLYAAYIVVRATLNPTLAPRYDVGWVPLRQKLLGLRHFLPLGIIVFLVLGTIFLGVATPTEAAALGVVGTLLAAALYRQLTLPMLYKSLTETARITVVVMMIIVGAQAFSQILAFTGGSRGLVELVQGLAVPPVVLLLLMLGVVVVLGCFISAIPIMMITIPIYSPLAHTLAFNEIWFGLLMLLTLEIGSTTPPFGLQLFVLKSVVPEASMGDVYWSCLPYTVIDMISVGVMIAFPVLVLLLPNLMMGK